MLAVGCRTVEEWRARYPRWRPTTDEALAHPPYSATQWFLSIFGTVGGKASQKAAKRAGLQQGYDHPHMVLNRMAGFTDDNVQSAEKIQEILAPSRSDGGTASAKAVVKRWNPQVVNDLKLTDTELSALLSMANLLEGDAEAVQHVKDTGLVSVFKAELLRVKSDGGQATNKLLSDWKEGVEMPPAKEAAAKRILKGAQEGAHILHNGGAAFIDYLAAVDAGEDSEVITRKKRKAEEAVEETQQKRNSANVGKHSTAESTGETVSDKRVRIKLQVNGEVITLKRDTFVVSKPTTDTVVGLHNALTYVNCAPEVRDAIKSKVQGVDTNSDFHRMFDGGRTDRKLSSIRLKKVDGQHGVQITAVEFCYD